MCGSKALLLHSAHCTARSRLTPPSACALQFCNIFKGVTQEKLDDLVERFVREEFHAGGGPLLTQLLWVTSWGSWQCAACS